MDNSNREYDVCPPERIVVLLVVRNDLFVAELQIGQQFLLRRALDDDYDDDYDYNSDYDDREINVLLRCFRRSESSVVYGIA